MEVDGNAYEDELNAKAFSQIAYCSRCDEELSADDLNDEKKSCPCMPYKIKLGSSKARIL